MIFWGVQKNSFLDFWRVSGPFPGPGPLQDDRAHRGGDFAPGPVSVARKVSENEPFEVSVFYNPL